MTRMLIVLGLSLAAVHSPALADEPIDFNLQIRPLLSNNCFQCHGPDADERQGGTAEFRLDTAEGAVVDLGGYRAIVAGKPDESELLRRITSTDELERMPPPETGKQLQPEDVELLRRWIRQGAQFAPHWSYIPPTRPELPPASRPEWIRSAIDHFVLARLEREGLQPATAADRYTLIRRVTLDLTGLPPTPAEVDRFVNDTSPDAYQKLVDRLLADPSFGERWGRVWLDLARYADSAGYADDPQRTIWGFRDYVVRSLNANKPFDQFTIEQLAGKLLENPTDEQLVATAFHRNTLTNNEGGTSDEEFRNVAIVDRVNTTMAVWMGTTMACAQCHTHKYDPITQEEYFRFFAFFNNTADADRRDESPLLQLYSDQQKAQEAAWQRELGEIEKQLATPTDSLRAAQREWEQGLQQQLQWHTVAPLSAESAAGVQLSPREDHSVVAAAGAAQDTYTLELDLPQTPIAAVRIEALADPTLPGSGPGLGGGNFVLTGVQAVVVGPESSRPRGRFVRIENTGKNQFLSLAEVQVFSGGQNLAPTGVARQISTAYDGPAKLAIDGNTNGDYDAKSTTHTEQTDNPWWELDLKQPQAVDRVVVWNRTDNNLHTRLKDFRIELLDDQRQVVWSRQVAEPPNPQQAFEVSDAKPVEFSTAFASHSQQEFAAAQVLKNPDPKNRGWAIAPRMGQTHQLTLVAAKPVPVGANAKLVLTLEQQSRFDNHVLGRFRIQVTADERAGELGKVPPELLELVRKPASERSADEQQKLAAFYLSVAPQLQDVRNRQAALKKQLAEMKPHTTVPIFRELPEGQRRTTRIQIRGNYQVTGAEVSEGVPAAFPELPPDAPRNRLTLARWLVDERNPLTARVIVNRHWEQIFGSGIVRTSEEFGAQGELPSHPELLDWLAVELMKSGWDTKRLLRTIVTSATYQQSSRVTPELYDRDPDNRLLARGPRLRLSAEMVRDQALAASGLLSRKLYGRSVQPPRPVLGLRAAFGGSTDWMTSEGQDRYRRGLYTEWRRSMPYPSMAAFDAPSREVCTVRRVRTNTPLQALVTLNDPVYIETAQALGRRAAATPGDLRQQLQAAFRLCLARPPQPQELDRLAELFAEVQQHYAQDTQSAQALATDPLGPLPEGMEVPTAAAWTVVANVLLNLDETIMKP